jgi:ribonuclease HII
MNGRHRSNARATPVQQPADVGALAALPANTAICGVDEAGRGPLAGPVIAAAVVLPAGHHIERLRESKMASEQQREHLYERIVSDTEIIWAVGRADVERIEAINILQATMEAMNEALRSVSEQCGGALPCICVDGKYFRSTDFTNVRTIVRGDALVPAIAAASILAKVTRDRWMREVADVAFPQYGFAQHKGYGTAAHRKAIKQYGACVLHRASFLRRI